MKSFSFKANYDENQNIEKIITERNRKIAKQQVIFAIVLFILVVLLAWYFVRKIIYTEFDGYVQTEYNNYRAMEDIYLFDQYTEVGDIVIPGDTLYSYTYINLFGVSNLESEPSVIVNDRNARLQLNMAYADANVLRVRIRELENQIAKEDNNIRFGLTDNSHKMDLQRQLAEAREQLNATMRKAHMYNDIHRESSSAAHRFGQYSVEFANEQWEIDNSLRQLYERNSSAIRYAIAQDTAIVTKLWSPPFSRVFKKEQILQLENVSLFNSNMQVVAYVPTGDMSKINNNTKAEVIVNDDVSFKVSVQLLGARTEDLPEELRNSLSHTYTTVMVVFTPDPGQVLPLWAAVDRVPVRIRINNFDNGMRNDGSDYWEIDEYGFTEKSRYFLHQQREQKNHRRRYRNHHPEDIPAEVKQEPQPEASEAAVKAADAEQPAAKAESPAKEGYKVHVVAKGETFYSIARQYDTDTNTVIRMNPEINPRKLAAGTKLKVPAENN